MYSYHDRGLGGIENLGEGVPARSKVGFHGKYRQRELRIRLTSSIERTLLRSSLSNRHSRESGNPGFSMAFWIPASAGMTKDWNTSIRTATVFPRLCGNDEGLLYTIWMRI
ncbi:MAG: hypothetical protein AB1847_18805 [bacterium]